MRDALNRTDPRVAGSGPKGRPGSAIAGKFVRTGLAFVLVASVIGCEPPATPTPDTGADVVNDPVPPPVEPPPVDDERADEKPLDVPVASDPADEAVTDTAWESMRNGPQKRGIADAPLPETLELLWTKEVPYGVPATCAVVGEHVFVPGLDGFLYCLKRTTGEEVWKHRSNGNPDPDAFAPGFKAAPTVTATTVYTGDEDGLVHALDRATGEKLWTRETGGEVRGGPTVCGEDGESLLVGSHGGGVYRLSAKTGKVEWAFEGIGPINLSPPIAGDRTFALGCETGDLVSVAIEDGKELKRFPLGETALATPAVYDGITYLGTYGGKVLAIDFAEGSTAWTFEPERQLEFHASCAVTDEHVFAAGRNKQLHCLDRKTGEELWAFQARAQINSSPVVAGDRVYFGSDDKHVYGVSIENGEKVFEHNLEEAVPAGPAIGEGVLVVGTEGNPGYVFCFGKK